MPSTRDALVPEAAGTSRDALLTAVAFGACHLALNGHLSRTGEGHASPADLVDHLLDQLGGRPAVR